MFRSIYFFVLSIVAVSVPGLLAADEMDSSSAVAKVTPLAAASTGNDELTPDGHPLLAVLTQGQSAIKQLSSIKDYTGRLIKRERLGSQNSHVTEYMTVKLRHRLEQDGQVVAPFSVYLKYLAPSDIRGREVIYVEDQHDGRMIARRGGTRLANLTLAISPRSPFAMFRNRYPLTDIGIRNMVMRLIEQGTKEMRYGECAVDLLNGVEFNKRTCRVIQVTHPYPRDHFLYHVAKLYIDEELDLPTRFVSYTWPEAEDAKPPLLEDYAFVDLKFNVGLTDADFDYRNEEYRFLKSFKP